MLRTGSVVRSSLDAPLGGRALGEEALEHPPRDANHPAVLTDLDPELHGPAIV